MIPAWTAATNPNTVYHYRMSNAIHNQGSDSRTGWDYLNGEVDGVFLHAVTAPRNGRHEGMISTPGGPYPISLDRSIADHTEDEVVTLVRELRAS